MTHVQLIDDPKDVALREAQNGLQQFDETMRMVRESNWQLALTPELILRLQRIATEGIWSSAGRFRQHSVNISNTPHQPPHFDQIPCLVDLMCDYANQQTDPFHVAAYLMWRLNWIHPFGDGNGRTSRAISYYALSVSLKMELPGSPTIPELIVKQRQPYYQALDAADAAWDVGIIDVHQMSELIQQLLTQQLTSSQIAP